jgi:L-threonylcarbamoyladenylate synthase
MTPETKTRVLRADERAVEVAAALLVEGRLVAFPTETVYGLGADARNGEAVAGLYAAKRRPAFNPLIAHVADVAAAERLAQFCPAAARLAQAFWPGPLTLVLPKQRACPVADLATAGLDSIALRVPRHTVAHAILQKFGNPVVAPSANRSGHVSPTSAEHVLCDLGGRIDLIVDAGPTPIGVESTIVALLGEPMLLRPGGVPRDQIEAVLGQKLADAPSMHEGAAPLAPGQLASHYAPRTRLRLEANHVDEGEALLAFGERLPQGAERAMKVYNLSPRGDLIEAAANLFSYLRALDAVEASAIAVMPVPKDDLGEAINDRLARAARGP